MAGNCGDWDSRMRYAIYDDDVDVMELEQMNLKLSRCHLSPTVGTVLHIHVYREI